MTNSISVRTVVVCALLIATAPGQDTQLSINDSYRLQLVQVRLLDGGFVGGELWNATAESLYVLRKGEVVSVSPLSIYKVTLARPESQKGQGKLGAVVFGAYAGAFVLLRERDPGSSTYISANGHAPYAVIMSVAAGAVAVGGLYSLLPSSSDSEYLIHRGTNDYRQEVWEELLNDIAGVEKDGVHFSVQGASVSQRWKGDQSASASYGYGYSSSDHFMLFRSVHFDIPYSPMIGFGGAYMNFEEQPVFNMTYGGPPDYSYTVTQMLYTSGSAFLGVATFRPLRNYLPPALDWEVTLGAGYANVKYKAHTYTGSVDIVRTDFDGGTWAMAGLTELTFNVNQGLYLGVSADIIQVGVDLAAVPEFSLGKTSMGNSSIGFSIGVRY